ncbi:hypothetical protein ACS0TY_027556 [Phlomoides rotata]
MLPSTVTIDSSSDGGSSTRPAVVPITAHHHMPIKLTHSNYSSWRAHLVALLRGHNILGFVDGKTPIPSLATDGSNASAVALWIQQDQLLLAVIFGSLSAEILPLVSTARSAAEAWAILDRLCNGLSRSRVNTLKSDLYQITIGDSELCWIRLRISSPSLLLALASLNSGPKYPLLMERPF